MESKKQKIGNWFRTSISAKMLMVGFIFLVLMVPLGIVEDLIRERGFRQTEVIQEINEKWGNEVVLFGPIIKVPYRTYKEEKTYDATNKTYIKTYEEVYHHAYFFPENLDIQANVDTKQLKRGIYESVVFTTDVNISGSFGAFDFGQREIPEKDILWQKASVLFKTTNLKGIRNEITIDILNSTFALKPQFDNAHMGTLETANLSLPTKKNPILDFTMAFQVNGSERLQFIPLGKVTTAQMTSDWHSPSFNGNFLPNDSTKQISKNGFNAQWKVLETNRQFGQQFFDKLPDLGTYAFGSSLIIPVDDYQKTERTSKYGLMIIGLTLLVFLLIQIISKIHIHPFQYLMIGLALVMFYTLLIAISEHQDYLMAYLLASMAVVGLISLYSRTILKGFKFALFIFSSMAVLYAFIFIIIQLEDYALLVGSIGLFIILATIMFASSKIDWNQSSS